VLADGIAITAGGLIILLSPGVTLMLLIRIIGLTALVVGMLELLAGVHLRRHLTDEWLLIIGGITSIVFAACLLLTHVGTVQTALTWIAIYALANGLALMGLALRLRRLKNSIHTLAATAPAKAAGRVA
jgi:uncharacterized membrane protein HdeD (DUF308 family)